MKQYGLLWENCVTARKPYDLAVQCVLLLLKAHYGELVEIGSVGGPREWQQALSIVKGEFGVALTYDQSVLGPRPAYVAEEHLQSAVMFMLRDGNYPADF